MWNTWNDFHLGSDRILTYKEENVCLQIRECCFCHKKDLSLRFSFTENHTCLDCLLGIIEKAKLYSFLEKSSP